MTQYFLSEDLSSHHEAFILLSPCDQGSQPAQSTFHCIYQAPHEVPLTTNDRHLNSFYELNLNTPRNAEVCRGQSWFSPKPKSDLTYCYISLDCNCSLIFVACYCRHKGYLWILSHHFGVICTLCLFQHRLIPAPQIFLLIAKSTIYDLASSEVFVVKEYISEHQLNH